MSVSVSPLTKQSVMGPAALPRQCRHTSIIAGLDRAYCPDCKKEFKPRTTVYRFAVKHSTPNPSLGGDESRPPEHSYTRPPEKSRRHTPASGWVEKYSKQQGRYQYYRYCWQTTHKGKINRLHIPSDGGKLAQVREAILSGRPPEEIQALLKKCSGGRAGGSNQNRL